MRRAVVVYHWGGGKTRVSERGMITCDAKNTLLTELDRGPILIRGIGCDECPISKIEEPIELEGFAKIGCWQKFRQEVVGRESIASGRGVHAGGPNLAGRSRRKEEGEGGGAYLQRSKLICCKGETALFVYSGVLFVGQIEVPRGEFLFEPQIKFYGYTNKKMVIL
jgi:hypothetical protein